MLQKPLGWFWWSVKTIKWLSHPTTGSSVLWPSIRWQTNKKIKNRKASLWGQFRTNLWELHFSRTTISGLNFIFLTNVWQNKFSRKLSYQRLVLKSPREEAFNEILLCLPGLHTMWVAWCLPWMRLSMEFCAAIGVIHQKDKVRNITLVHGLVWLNHRYLWRSVG